VTARCKRVIAVEPSLSMCRLIEELFKLRNEPCPCILNCLLGGEPGKAFFLENVENPEASRITPEPVPNAYELPVRTIDEIVETMEEKPTFIKCDAEGSEMEIFSGGKHFLQQFHPKLAVTTYHNDEDYAGMHKLLKAFGYRVMGKGFLYSQGSLRVMMIHAW
jgi:FkbM family methyltransferase